jgi:hypothetical protein
MNGCLFLALLASVSTQFHPTTDWVAGMIVVLSSLVALGLFFYTSETALRGKEDADYMAVLDGQETAGEYTALLAGQRALLRHELRHEYGTWLVGRHVALRREYGELLAAQNALIREHNNVWSVTTRKALGQGQLLALLALQERAHRLQHEGQQAYNSGFEFNYHAARLGRRADALSKLPPSELLRSFAEGAARAEDLERRIVITIGAVTFIVTGEDAKVHVAPGRQRSVRMAAQGPDYRQFIPPGLRPVYH